MISKPRLPILILSFLLFSTDLICQDSVKYLLAGQVLDVKTGRYDKNVLITIEKNIITDVNIKPDLRKITEYIDLTEYTVLPGLIDCHTHLADPSFMKDFDYYSTPAATYGILGVKFANKTLQAGFTTVRDLGANFNSDIALRDAIQNGWIDGPRMFVSGTALTITGGHGAWGNWLSPDLQLKQNPGNTVDGADEVRKATRALIKKGVDLIKINASGGFGTSGSIPGAASFTVEEMKAAVDEARKRGLKVAAHAHGAESIQNAIAAGVHSIEHATFLDEENIALMKEKQVYLVMDLLAAYVDLVENNQDYSDKELASSNLTIYQAIEEKFENAYKQGVRMAFGTDASVFEHGRNAEQFNLMQQAGMESIDVLRAATIHGAELIGISAYVGTIEKGKWADIIAVKGNPLRDITVLENIKFVMKDGEVYRLE